MRGQVAGVLYASNPVAQPFTDREEAILVRLAVHAAVAIQNAQLYQQAQDELRERRKIEAALAQAAAELQQRVEARTVALHQAIAARQRLEQEAQQATHFAVLGQLAAGVSHEIRNPLGAIFLHVDLLEEELRAPSPDDAEAVPAALAEIKTQLARLDDLVQDYLTLVRVSGIQREVQDLGAAVQGWGRELAALARPRGATVALEGVEDMGRMAFHANTLYRAVLNLVQNALDAMPGGARSRWQATAPRRGCSSRCAIRAAACRPSIWGRFLSPCIPPNRAGRAWGSTLRRRLWRPTAGRSRSRASWARARCLPSRSRRRPGRPLAVRRARACPAVAGDARATLPPVSSPTSRRTSEGLPRGRALRFRPLAERRAGYNEGGGLGIGGHVLALALADGTWQAGKFQVWSCW